MNNFVFYSPVKLIFGKDTEGQIGSELKPYAKKVLLHYGGGSIKRSGLYDTVVKSLKESGVEYVELGGVQPNPILSLVHKGVEICKKEKVDLVLAVGGGSAIDSAKAIALGACYDGDVWDFYDNGREVEKALPVAVILTIPAAGSESSGDSVITNDETERKLACGSPKLRPLVSIMNPELFFTLPKEQLGYGVADMIAHVFERYFTNTVNADLTDRLCEATLQTLIRYAMPAKKNMKDYNAWAELGFAGTIAHNGLLGMGREESWACHIIEHELSAIYDVAHGAGLAVVIPGYMRYVYKDNVNMFVQFAVNVMGVKAGFRDPDAIALEGIDRLAEFFVSLGLPSTLKELGIGEDRLAEMAKKSTGAAFGEESPLGGVKKLYWQDVLAIYESVK
jgi:alcohol dehydrogenase YqhD (iron-dependent ADH family)